MKRVYFYEEAVESGGVGDRFAALLQQNGINCAFVHHCANESFVKQAPVAHQMMRFGLDVDSIVREVSHAE